MFNVCVCLCVCVCVCVRVCVIEVNFSVKSYLTSSINQYHSMTWHPSLFGCVWGWAISGHGEFTCTVHVL